MALFGAAILATSSAASAATLKWVGCGISNKAFMSALADAYQQETGTLIELEGGGATRGIRDTASGESDLGGSCRHKILAHEETNANLIPVGWDAIVAITHPSNPVTGMTSEQLKDVMTGAITNWSELGGPDAPIKLVIRQGKISGVGLMARELLFENPEQDFSADAEVVRSTGPAEKFVEEDPLGIALTGISSAKKRNVAMIALDGAEPTYETISQGAYPVYRPLYVVAPKDPSDEVKQFVAFATGPAGQEIIKAQGTVNMQDGAGLWTGYREKMAEARKAGGF